jgi:S-DNA-T family DNA segregation ATPase FtsK/SpoIIIE
MEELGIVGPFEGSKPRQLLISYQQWQEMQFINGTAPIGSGMPPKDDFENPDFIDESDE